MLLLVLAPERLRFGTGPDELAPAPPPPFLLELAPLARARLIFFLGGLWEGLVLKRAAGKTLQHTNALRIAHQ